MIDLQTGQVIDMIHSRKLEDVTDWLKNYSEPKLFQEMVLMYIKGRLETLLLALFKLLIDFI